MRGRDVSRVSHRLFFMSTPFSFRLCSILLLPEEEKKSKNRILDDMLLFFGSFFFEVIKLPSTTECEE